MPHTDKPVFVPAPALPPGPRHALIIATARYGDAGLRQLRSPVRDAEDFAAVLADPEIGGFEVKTLIDRTEPDIRRALAEFLDGRGTDETVLVYLSCHGIQDRRGRLYFAATDTTAKYPQATAIRSTDLLDGLDECRARRQVVILDCCFSGSFADHKGGPNFEQQLAGHSRGREILTASRGFEYSLEGKPVGDEITGSVFTTGLVTGLRTGAADLTRHGYISVEDVYKYAFRHVQDDGADQTPQHWLFGGEGERIILGRSVVGRVVAPARLPEDLANNLESRYPDIRIGAVNALAEWLQDGDSAHMVAALRALQEVAENDIARVAQVAQSHVAGFEANRQGPQTAQAPLPEPTTSDANLENESKERITGKFRDIIADQLGVGEDEIRLKSRFIEDLGADSLDLVEITMAVEETFEITVDDSDLAGIETVGHAVEFISERRRARQR